MRTMIVRVLALVAVVGLALTACSPGPTASGEVAFSSSTASVTEGASVTLTVERTGGSDGAATVDFSTIDGTATAGTDFTAASGTLNWSDGDSSNKTITVNTIGNATVDGDKDFTVELTNASGASLGTPAQATVTVEDDDTAAPSVVSTNPSDGDTGVGLNVNINVTFSEAMNESATESAFTESPNINCTFTWNSASDRLTCDPATDLNPNDTYTITIDTGAEDASGNALASDFTFTFDTGSGAATTCEFDSGQFGSCVFGS